MNPDTYELENGTNWLGSFQALEANNTYVLVANETVTYTSLEVRARVGQARGKCSGVEATRSKPAGSCMPVLHAPRPSRSACPDEHPEPSPGPAVQMERRGGLPLAQTFIL